ncbi:MAG TPA: isoleucine--tRNA ligase [Dehalococcoidia bacterium]|nr:isoleucine--tRNA ligase [Dehalococcoidia bacterium]
MTFKPVASRVDFVALEHDIQRWWDERDIMRKYLRRNERAEKRWSFIDGPITANNPMGVHHAWGRSYKDLYQRYKTMQGFRQRYQNGFDCQGLWIEVEVEKELGFKSKRDIEKFGIDRFVEACKERVRRFSKIQTEQSIRLGYWMDWDNSYYTNSDENNYTIWAFLKKCWERGFLYKGKDCMPWCPRCGTGISQHEIVTEGYRELTHASVYLKFPLNERPGESLLVWTTTPWTLAANVAAAVHPELTYVKVRQGDDVLYVSKGAVSSAIRGSHEVVGEVKGADLVGLTYRGPFDELPAQEGVVHRVIEWDEVSDAEGTGIVHIAPGAGAEDFALSKVHGLDVIAPLDEEGNYVPGPDGRGFGWLDGKNVADVADAIFEDLKAKGLLYRVQDYTHRYPVCWRCESELIFRLVDEWFIAMDELRYEIMEVAKRARWIPEFGLARELDWLRNMHDWMISKKRYYGLALPIYECAACGHFEVIGSEYELEARAVEGWERFKGHSPHRPWIDAVKIACSKCGAKVSRIKDVGNPWLDAGIVPYSTLKYRHDRKYWEEWFPADWVSESFPGQFRNWFYSLLAMSTVMEGREPFKTLFSYALLRDERGEEMHKSKGNAIWFDEAAERMGVDVMRWMFFRQPPANNLNFGWHYGDEIRRGFFSTLWNTYAFFVTYANIDGWTPAAAPAPPPAQRPELDRWALSELHQLVSDVTAALDEYDAMTATRRIETFVDDLSNWYVRRSRRRFWKSGDDADKRSAYATLWTCLTTLDRLLAPMLPFLAEELYQNLVRSWDAEAPESVHLCDWPTSEPALIDRRLAEDVRLVQRLASLGRSARARANIKVRQPLRRVYVKTRAPSEGETVRRLSDQLLEELNVKELELISDEAEFFEYQVRPNLPVLGPKYGGDVGRIQRALASADRAAVARAVAAGEPVELDGFRLEPDELLVSTAGKPGYAVAEEAGYAVVVTTEITPDLADEGLARELVRRIQDMRKSAGFEIADRIRTSYDGDADVARVMETWGEYIRQETLSVELRPGSPPPGAHAEEHTVDGRKVTLAVERV